MGLTDTRRAFNFEWQDGKGARTPITRKGLSYPTKTIYSTPKAPITLFSYIDRTMLNLEGSDGLKCSDGVLYGLSSVAPLHAELFAVSEYLQKSRLLSRL